MVFRVSFMTSLYKIQTPMKVSISSRELEILRKSADGLSVQQIADEMKVSQQQITKSQKEIMVKTGSGNVLNALQALAKKGFVLTEDKPF
jgi:DNA-binding NarL/FixJ family response regulator